MDYEVLKTKCSNGCNKELYARWIDGGKLGMLYTTYCYCCGKVYSEETQQEYGERLQEEYTKIIKGLTI